MWYFVEVNGENEMAEEQSQECLGAFGDWKARFGGCSLFFLVHCGVDLPSP